MNQQMPMGNDPYASAPQSQYPPQTDAVPPAGRIQEGGYADPGTQPPQSGGQGTSGLAVAGLVLGIIGVATSFIPIVNNVSFFIGIIGLVLGIIGLVGIGKGKKRGRGLAIAGIVLGVATVVIVLASQAFYSAAIDEAFNTSGSTTSNASASSMTQASSSEATAAAQPASQENEYTVSIDSATLTEDYSGAAAVVVTYTWTNNSDSTTSFATSLYAKCFQDGVQCDTAIVSGMDSNYMTDVKPGVTNTVQQAYKVNGTSPVTVEVTELISLNKDILAEREFTLA